MSMLHIKPEDVENVEKRGKYTIGIIGCEQIGLLHASLFAEAGFKVTCIDTNQAIVNLLTKGKAPFLKHEIEPMLKKHVKGRKLNATNDVKAAVARSDVIMVTTPVKVDERGKINYSDMENTCKLVGLSFHQGALVIITSIVGIGIFEGLVRETLESASGFKVGIDFGLAYSPIRFLDSREQTLEKLAGYERIVAATDKNSLDAASTVLGTIAKRDAVKTNDVKTAETVTLFEAIHDYVNLNLATEFALFCQKAGVDYVKVQKLAKKGKYGELPQSTLTCEKNHTELHLLLEEAENLNVKLRVPTAVTETNKEILRHAVNLIRDALKGCGKTVRRTKISLLGISQTPNTMDIPKKSAKTLAKMLETKGAKISLYDPYLSSNELTDFEYALKKNLAEAVEGADCIVILTGHDQFKRLSLKRLKVVAKMPVAIVDFEGIMEPEKVELEGFIYRGLGRGVWTK
jgi:nucleotide sugar dehydrogenase